MAIVIAMSDESFHMSDDEPMAVAEVGAVAIASDPLHSEASDLVHSEASDKEAPADNPRTDSPIEDQADPPQVQPEPTEESQQEAAEVHPASPSKRNSTKPKRDKPPTGLPVLTPATVNSMTYDLDQLLDPKLQRKLEERGAAPFSSDFVKMNRELAGKPQATRSRDDGSKGRPSYNDPVNVEERFYKYRKSVEDKIKLMEEELRRKERETCTFTPSIKSKPSASTDGARAPDEFYKDMMRHKQEMDDKLKQLREESDKAQKSQEDAYFRPQLCAKSKAILEAKKEPEVPVHEKLYKAHKTSMQRQMKAEGGDAVLTTQASVDSMKPFTPAINKVSQSMVREKPIEQHLLEDAERRLKKLESTPARPASQKLLSSNSEQLLLRKFKDEFAAAWEAMDTEHSHALNYTKTAELLKELHFIENEMNCGRFETERAMVKGMWTMMQLSEDGLATKDNLETFLLAIMNFSVPSESRVETKTDSRPTEEDVEGKVETEPKAEQRLETASEASRATGRMENGVLVVTAADCRRLHFQYKEWYDHRLRALKALKGSKVEDQYSFKPELAKTSKAVSEAVAARRPEGSKHELQLLAEHAKKQERLREMQEKAARDQMKECVFRPKIDKRSAKILAAAEEHKGQSLSTEYLKILKEKASKPVDKTTALYSLASVSQQRRKQMEKSPEEMELEAQEVECTFAPDLKKTRNFVSGQGAFADPPKGVDKVVERMARARQDAEEIRALRESGLSYRGKKEKKQAESKTEGPLVVLAVQVSGRAEELRVRPGDDLEALIGAFAAQHRLSTTEAQLVGEQLRNQYEQATGSASDD